jgi:hypothetical protein
VHQERARERERHEAHRYLGGLLHPGNGDAYHPVVGSQAPRAKTWAILSPVAGQQRENERVLRQGPTMHFSDAVMLGAVITDPEPFNLNHCAVGMGANALGIPESTPSQDADGSRRRLAILATWPWLNHEDNFWLMAHWAEVYAIPHDHWPERSFRLALETPWNFIAMVFNFNVFPGRVALEQLVEYIRKMEPECAECNRFDCHCHDLFSALRAEQRGLWCSSDRFADIERHQYRRGSWIECDTNAL